MRVGILGSGLMGGKLGTILARAGHHVTFSYARDPAKLERLAGRAGPSARPGTPLEAARDADALLLAVHWSRVDEVLGQVGGELASKTLLTCTLPMSEDDSHLVVGLTSSGAEELAHKAPRAHVVSAFSTAPSEVLFAVSASRGGAASPDLVYCGDDASAKRTAARLISDVGFNPVDAGGLTTARFIEPYALLVAKLAYEGSGSPALGYRFSRLAELTQ